MRNYKRGGLRIINSEYSRLSNNREECLQRLAEIREDVMHMYADGTIPKHYFDNIEQADINVRGKIPQKKPDMTTFT